MVVVEGFVDTPIELVSGSVGDDGVRDVRKNPPHARHSTAESFRPPQRGDEIPFPRVQAADEAPNTRASNPVRKRDANQPDVILY